MRYTKPDPKPIRLRKERKKLTRRAMVRKRARRIDQETPLEKRYRAWIHVQWCAAVGTMPGHTFCVGPIQMAHFRNMTGTGRKESSIDSIALCRAAHESYDQALCYFAGMSKEDRKRWFMARLIETHAQYQLETGEPLLPDAFG